MFACAENAGFRPAGVAQWTGKIVDRAMAREINRPQPDTSRNVRCSFAAALA